MHTVIYVPGIGDDTKKLQRSLLRFWRIYGVKPIIHEMPWMDTESFAPKLLRLVKRIDDAHAKGDTVSLVGASAGASAVLNAFAARKDKVNGVVCIAGKINNPDTIGERYRRRSPSFIESAMQAQFSLDQLDFDKERKRIMSRYAVFDPVIPQEDSKVAGGINRRVFTIGHTTTIAEQLTLGAPHYLGWLKRLAECQ